MRRHVFIIFVLLGSFTNAVWAMEFSADQTTRIGKSTMTGKIYISAGSLARRNGERGRSQGLY
ncbi:MAG: hypothetical protein ABJB49_00325 [Nitrospirota bacterium]